MLTSSTSMNAPFKTIALIGRFADPLVADAMLSLAEHAATRGVRVVIDAECPVEFRSAVERIAEAELSTGAELLVSVGGDGTLLHAARLAHGTHVPLLGINRGRLGFLADVSAAEMLERFEEVLSGRYSRDVRHVLEARIAAPGAPERHARALNDVVLQKWQTGRMLDFETWIDGRYVNTHGGDGLLIATATGSTGYAMSCGGPIVEPNLEALVLVPICPHTLSDRPIVVNARSQIEVRIVAQAPVRAQVTTDGVVLDELQTGARLLVRRADSDVTLLHPPGYDFYRILR
ncbi:MAG TPA: NAD(+)/NADH kinase, partial [Steroidobacteraceae bacterium]|nr:NAD(+)/NADH kinase [Steroidobacteraceae bacterium]